MRCIEFCCDHSDHVSLSLLLVATPHFSPDASPFKYSC